MASATFALSCSRSSSSALRPDLGPAVFAPGLREVLTDRRFQNLILSRRTFTLDESRRAGELRRVIDRVRSLIEQQLELDAKVG